MKKEARKKGKKKKKTLSFPFFFSFLFAFLVFDRHSDERMTPRRPLQRRGHGLPLLPLLFFFLLSFLSSSSAAREQGTETTRPPPPPLSVVRLRSLELGPPGNSEEGPASFSKRLFPFPRLLLEQEDQNPVPAPPLPDARDQRWGPLSKGKQAVVSFGGVKSPLSSSSSSSSSSLSPSAATVAAIEAVNGTVSDSLPEDALLAVGLTEKALAELERDDSEGGGKFFIFLL